MAPDVPRSSASDDFGMANQSRLWIELENSETGPPGVARDDAGRARRFSGWLELIALIEPGEERRHVDAGSSRDLAHPSTPESGPETNGRQRNDRTTNPAGACSVVDLPPDASEHREPAALLRLPLVYAGIGFGIWRGVQVRVWRDAAHRYFVQGTRVTLALWGALISKMILSARRSAES